MRPRKYSEENAVKPPFEVMLGTATLTTKRNTACFSQQPVTSVFQFNMKDFHCTKVQGDCQFCLYSTSFQV